VPGLPSRIKPRCPQPSDTQEIDFGLRGLPREFPDSLSAAAARQIAAKASISLLKDGSVPIATARPWRNALRRLRRRPTSDLRPVLFCAFFRFEAAFRSDVIVVIPPLR
jgi:hypothetical protein